MPRAARQLKRRTTPGAGVPLELYLRRRRGRAVAVFLFVIALAAVLIWADHHGHLGGHVSDMTRYGGRRFVVTHVVDGDTLDIAAPDGSKPFTRVRFWGIDTPEMDHPGHAEPRKPFAVEATEFTRQRAEGKTVRLHLEAQRPRDVHGRLLAFVELPDGATLNEELLAKGLAKADDRWVHQRLERYKRLEDQAKHDHAGLWGDKKKKAATRPE